MSSENKSISISLDTETEQLLKAGAALSGMSVENFCLIVIKERAEETVFPKGRTNAFTEESVKKLFALRDEIFQGRVSSTDTVDLIREARGRRSKRQEELGRS